MKPFHHLRVGILAENKEVHNSAMGCNFKQQFFDENLLYNFL